MERVMGAAGGAGAAAKVGEVEAMLVATEAGATATAATGRAEEGMVETAGAMEAVW